MDRDSEPKSERRQEKDDAKLFRKEVDISKVNEKVIKHWLSEQFQKLLPEDDVALEFIYELLVGAENGNPDIGTIREQMDDFVGKDQSLSFCRQLWSLLVSGQNSKDGIPQELVEERKKKLEQKEENKAPAQKAEEFLSNLQTSIVKKGSRSRVEKPRHRKSSALLDPRKQKKTNYNRS